MSKTTRSKLSFLSLIIAILILAVAVRYQSSEIKNLQATIQEQASEKAPEIIEGQYTIIHYPPGWTNAIYITEYYLDGKTLWFKEKGSTEFKPIWFPGLLPVDGWIEGEALMNYGYWISEYE
jgi:hypothetical protein